jgi:hypothetical protein
VHHAYGLYQIRYPYLKDVNRIAGKDVMRVWGVKKLYMSDMQDGDKARWAMRVYLSYYGKRYTRLTGLKPTPHIYARIHNGGPDGWKDKTTLAYWRSVRAYLGRLG